MRSRSGKLPIKLASERPHRAKKLVTTHLSRVVKHIGFDADPHAPRCSTAEPQEPLALHATGGVGGAQQMDRVEHRKVRKRHRNNRQNLLDAKVRRGQRHALNVARLVLQPRREMLDLRIGQILEHKGDHGPRDRLRDFLERQGNVLDGRGVDQNDHLALIRGQIMEQEVVFELHGTMGAQHVGLFVFEAVKDTVHVAFQIDQGGTALDGDLILLDAAEIAVEDETDLVEEEHGSASERAKEGHGLRSVT